MQKILLRQAILPTKPCDIYLANQQMDDAFKHRD